MQTHEIKYRVTQLEHFSKCTEDETQKELLADWVRVLRGVPLESYEIPTGFDLSKINHVDAHEKGYLGMLKEMMNEFPAYSKIVYTKRKNSNKGKLPPPDDHPFFPKIKSLFENGELVVHGVRLVGNGCVTRIDIDTIRKVFLKMFQENNWNTRGLLPFGGKNHVLRETLEESNPKKSLMNYMLKYIFGEKYRTRRIEQVVHAEIYPEGINPPAPMIKAKKRKVPVTPTTNFAYKKVKVPEDTMPSSCDEESSDDEDEE